ncbi:MAG: spore cortex biosynthesis protein YabQ [Clostridia bacterium]|nr:spore cortex biosynthesis protein YabQ [Clostridia bacterium]
MFVVEREELLRFFFRSFLLGALYACAYLIAGFVRKVFGRMRSVKLRAVLLFVFDFALCLTAAFFDALLVFAANRGQLRIFALIMQIGGFALLYLPLRRYVYAAQEKLISGIYDVIFAPIVRRCERIRNKRMRKKEKRAEKRFDRNADRLLIKKMKNASDEIFGDVFGKR